MIYQLTFFTAVLFTLCACHPEKKEPIAMIATPLGTMYFEMYDDTPGHKESFIQLANAGYWDTLTFNRVIEDFVIQGGCPDTPEGFADSPYLLKPEFRDTIKHIYGALGAGRDGNAEKLSAGCQFYIVDNKEGIPRLDMNYMIFGQMLKGYDVLDKIAKTPTDSTDTPITAVDLTVSIVEMTQKEIREMRDLPTLIKKSCIWFYYMLYSYKFFA